MPQYIISYLGGDKPASPEDGQKHFVEYQKWLATLGDAAVKPMVPHKNIHTIMPDKSITTGSSVAMTGHTIVQAESIDAVIKMSTTCPFLDINGSLEIAELVEM